VTLRNVPAANTGVEQPQSGAPGDLAGDGDPVLVPGTTGGVANTLGEDRLPAGPVVAADRVRPGRLGICGDCTGGDQLRGWRSFGPERLAADATLARGGSRSRADRRRWPADLGLLRSPGLPVMVVPDCRELAATGATWRG
jgi:hypothetical protein